MSISRHDERADEFISIIQSKVEGLSLDAFGEHVRSTAYKYRFCELFAELAPHAWDELLKLTPLAESFLRSHAAEEQRLKEALNDEIRRWASTYGITADWLHAVATVTLLFRIDATELGLTPYRTLNPLVYVPAILICPDGTAIPLARDLTLDSWVSSSITTDIGVKNWNPLKETRAKFRDEIVREFTKHVEEQLDAAPTSMLNPDLTTANTEWVKCFLLHRVRGESRRAVAKMIPVSRPTVDKALVKIPEYLHFHVAASH